MTQFFWGVSVTFRCVSEKRGASQSRGHGGAQMSFSQRTKPQWSEVEQPHALGAQFDQQLATRRADADGCAGWGRKPGDSQCFSEPSGKLFLLCEVTIVRSHQEITTLNIKILWPTFQEFFLYFCFKIIKILFVHEFFSINELVSYSHPCFNKHDSFYLLNEIVFRSFQQH